MLSRILPALAAAAVAAACSSGHRASPGSALPSEKTPSVPPAAPSAFEAARARGEAATSELANRFRSRLFEELERSGPAGAVSVCREEAQRIASQVATERGVRIGRTSLRLRNPLNAPPAWVRPLLIDADRRKPEEVTAMVVDLGERVGVVRPIIVSAPCTQCHGTAKQIAVPVRELLERAYPQDAAVGYAPGDLRGFYWAEAPK